jgi:hypothetical protein
MMQNDKEDKDSSVVILKDDENDIFFNCIYKRVGKSPCTVDALKTAEQTHLPKSKQNFVTSFLISLVKGYPLLTCLSLFIFSFGLLVFDISTDVKLVWEFYHADIELVAEEVYKVNSDEIAQDEVQPVSSQLPNFYKFLLGGGKKIRNALLGLTLFAIIMPLVGYFVSWLTSNNLGFVTLKNKVIRF